MSDLPLKLVAKGKVRELYEVDDDHLLLVASDRLSAYDVVLPTAVPDKGAVLTGLSVWWFAQLADVGRVLGKGSGDIVAVITNLQTFVAALRDSNTQIVEFQDFATQTQALLSRC